MNIWKWIKSLFSKKEAPKVYRLIPKFTSNELKIRTMLSIAHLEDGVSEIPGQGENTPRILEYLSTVKGYYKYDETAWCAAFMNWVLVQSGLKGTGLPNARSFIDLINIPYWKSVSINEAKLGDIVVLWSESPSSWRGHVGFFRYFNEEMVGLFGGNQRSGNPGDKGSSVLQNTRKREY